ncbi:MAG TPA: CDGSH iron-sulfur domain-containing protein [Nitrososphaera sp.]|nr:CDGSH iron-sulfur domain-containing protein [Nitrososphaera sp.]
MLVDTSSSIEPKSLAEKPQIIPVPNGPLYLINSRTPQKVGNLQNSRGEPISKIVSVALCRCGGSKNKPFCGGTHGPSRFSSENTSPPQSPDIRKDYLGKKITVHDNRRICSHSAECLRRLESVFNLQERPWINPDQAAVESVIDTVKKCPSGALSYSVDGLEHRDQIGRRPVVIVDKNGPYRVEGGVELVGIENWALGASKEHYTLCRCGASNNKPFCDGMHQLVRFNDEKH